MVSCVKDFYIPPLLKTLAGVVFKRRQCGQVMVSVVHFGVVGGGGGGVGREDGGGGGAGSGRGVGGVGGVGEGWVGGNYVTWTRHMTI